MSRRRPPLLWLLPVACLASLMLSAGAGQACDSGADTPPKAKSKGK